jgi:acetoin utilization protein AcuB
MAFFGSKKAALTVAEAMSPHPYTISCYEYVSAAKRLMGTHHIRHLPAVDGKQVVGVLSERDIKAAEAIYQQKNLEGHILVREILFSEPYTVSELEPLHKVAATMAAKRLGSAVVVREGEVVGIFTTIDACRLLAELTK